MAVDDPKTTDRDEELVSVPRWVLAILAEEVEMRTDCGGPNDTPNCVRCDAIRIGKERAENG